jgi:hypothetical protein
MISRNLKLKSLWSDMKGKHFSLGLFIVSSSPSLDRERSALSHEDVEAHISYNFAQTRPEEMKISKHSHFPRVMCAGAEGASEIIFRDRKASGRIVKYVIQRYRCERQSCPLHSGSSMNTREEDGGKYLRHHKVSEM